MQSHQNWIAPKQPIWLHKNQQFIKAVIKQIFKQIITCTLQSGDNIKTKRVDIYHRNLQPIDPTRTDLMQNDIINQPELLQHLSVRFLNKKIYTYVENTLIAVNPYYKIPQLYTDQVKDSYVSNVIQLNVNMKQQQPHIYVITAEMVRSLFNDNCSQAVIISGQSGAGKTQVNKQCLRFLAYFFHKLAINQHLKQSNIQRAIMLSNPILQAFGNAKTIRNNNSSRFGKFLSIMVDNKTKQIKHAEIYNYLLQKSRIISRSKQQQNFHIFYQFLIKTTFTQKTKYCLIDPQTNKQMTFQSFQYTKNDSQLEYMAHPDVSFQKIKQSLTILPDPNSYDYLCRVLSAVLHLGNLQPYQDQNLDNCQILPDQSFDIVCNLLEIEKKYLFDSLTSYSIKVGGEDLTKSFSKREVQQLIHSLSKTLYQRLFQWIINQINRSTRSKDISPDKLLSLGFLDIYGFQVLKSNSLEQLFINYTNQRLHQLYLQKIFKLEKQYFIAQKLQNKFRQVDFEDNIKVIQLIDYEKLSIFNLLDDQCGIASPDQTTFITKIRFNHKKHQKFPPSNLNLISTQFLIKHTPQQIQYSVVGFRDKNRDLLREQIKLTIRSSKLKVLQTMFTQPKLQTQLDSKAHKVRKFLSSKFRKQMNQLINGLLNKSQQHFIRCIKSNGHKKPMEIQQQIVYSQIKYLGILDTIKIKKMSYSTKIKYQDFDKRFPWIIRKQIMEPANNKQIIAGVKNYLPKFGEQQILFGATKIFFRDYAFAILIKKYNKLLFDLKVHAHRLASAFIKNRYLKKKQRQAKHKSIVLTYLKGFLQTRKFKKLIKNITKVQKVISKFLLFRNQAKKLESIQTIQAYIKRNIQTKKRVKQMNMIQKVVFKFKFLLFRKKIRSRLVVEHAINNVILKNFWETLRQKNLKILSKYFHSVKIRITKKDQIALAIKNQRNTMEGKSLFIIENYILTFSSLLNLKKRLTLIKKIQSNLRTYLIRSQYLRQQSKVISLQRAIRQYLFLKKGAKKLFDKTYSSYEENIKTQAKLIQNKLYDSETTHSQQLNLSIKKFLGKFKQKMSLLYLVIDFQSFVDLQIVYPTQSWLTNYFQIFQQGLEKNDPVQYLSVGETFTVGATTTKMFLWGMHDSYKNLQPDAISQIKTKTAVEFYEIHKNKLNFSYVKEDENERKNMTDFKICSTVAKDYNLENGKIYQCLPNQLKLIKGLSTGERVMQLSCGKSHTIFRTTSKKIYSFGYGRQGQLGHSTYNSQQNPRPIKFFQNMKTSNVVQVIASFTSSLVLLSNRKLYWFGKNNTLSQVSTPTLFQLKSKFDVMSTGQFAIGRILSTWSRTMSVIGITVVCYNGKFQNNLALRNKTTDILFTKWQQAGIYNINPPVISSVSDHLEQCHVKLRNKKINIYPESKTTLKQMQQKIKSISSLELGLQNSVNRNSVGTQFSFSNTQKNSFFK